MPDAKPGCVRVAALLCMLLALPALCGASGPRWSGGYPWFTDHWARGIGWKGPTLIYSTDPGSLGTHVNHAAADALVAAAAGAWNLPVANLTLSQGAPLAEHVTGQDVYLDTSGMVYPADVMSGNASAVPLAVIYDTDGSVTDSLLGGGASDPSECRSNAVTESVDLFDPAGYILHAVLVVNGRCTGPAPEQQRQLQYQLLRAFGRVLGVGWSQTNDNVFTGVPQPTYDQAMHWPIMHPLEIQCGLYTYQCLPSPFQLRADDIASMVDLYAIGWNTPLSPGKQVSLQGANQAQGYVRFASGAPMAGVNVLERRVIGGAGEGWYETSAVSGAGYLGNGTSPFVTAPSGAAGSFGTLDPNYAAYYFIGYMPMHDGETQASVITSTEALNPLYTGAYSVGPYGVGNVTPAGSPPVAHRSLYVGQYSSMYVDFTIADGPTVCGDGSDGTADLPMDLPPTGWWHGLLCGHGHASYIAFAPQPGRTFTVEVTALDEQGFATTNKAMPTIALFAPTDAAGTLPSLGLTATAFNALGVGTSVLRASSGAHGALRAGIADQRGEGRPDFAYQARLFYADRITPATVPTAGGTVAVISGNGFRQGNAVLVHGVAATVTSWTASTITLKVPAMIAAGATANVPVDVTVLDRGTGASSIMSGALTYNNSAELPNAMRILSAQAGTAFVGTATPVPFSVMMVASDGVTPVSGAAVVFSMSAGSASFGVCGGPSCTVLTDASGVASTAITPLAAGTVTMQAAVGAIAQSASFTAEVQASRMLILSVPDGSLKVGEFAATRFRVQILAADGTPLTGRAMKFSVPAGAAIFQGCMLSVCTLETGWAGTADVWVEPTAVGPFTIAATAGDLTQTVSLMGADNSDVIVIDQAPGSNGVVGKPDGIFSIRLLQADGVTPEVGKYITYTAPVGVVFNLCGTNVCQLTTDWTGGTGTQVIPQQPGTYTLQVAYGAVVRTATITVAAAGTVTLKVLSAPSGNVPVGATAPVAFSAELLDVDGVTPLLWTGITLSGPPGVILNACGRNSCLLMPDANGVVSTQVTPHVAGQITLSAISVPYVQTATFMATGGTETMVVLTQPGAAGVYQGDEVVLDVRVLEADGVTPANGRVTFSVLSGPFALTRCPFTTCAFFPDGNGEVPITGVAWGTGTIVVQATDSIATQTMTFVARAKAPTMVKVSGPNNPSFIGVASSPDYVLKVLNGDGATPRPGASVTLALVGGSASISACGNAATCVVTSDSAGLVRAGVTPTGPGIVSLVATFGTDRIEVDFWAVPRPNTLRLVSAPSGTSFVGAATASAFAVQVLAGDGVTPVAGETVVFAGPTGVQFGVCGAAACPVVTGSDGIASTTVTAIAAGSFALTATDGALAQSASFTAVMRPDVLSLVSVPANGALVGDVAALSFSVQVLRGDGTVAVGASVTLSVTDGPAYLLACGGASSCVLQTDASGRVTSAVTPLAAGTIGLQALDGAVSVSGSFSAMAKPDVLTLVSVPANGALAGDVAGTAFAVRVLAGDGVTPVGGKSVVLAVTSGSAQLMACGAPSCSVLTDASGLASTGVEPLAAGTVALLATEEGASGSAVSGAFAAVWKAETAVLASVPAPSVFVGATAAGVLSVQVRYSGSGVPVSGVSVTFAQARGSAGAVQFGACDASACTVTTDAQGIATTAVTGITAGQVTLLATAGLLAGAQTLSASLLVVANAYAMRAVEGTTYVAEGAAFAVTLHAVATQNGVAAAGRTVRWTGSASAILGTSDSVSDATGTSADAVTFGPLAAAAGASVTACAWGTACASFTAVGVPATQFEVAIVEGGLQVLPAGTAPAPVAARVTDAAGDPVAGATVRIDQTVTALDAACPDRGRCPAAPVLLSGTSAAVSDANGMVTVVPLQAAPSGVGAGTETHLAFSAGPQGFATTTVAVGP